MIPIIEIPLNIEHWDFYVLPTYIINEKCQEPKTLSLNKAIKIGAKKCKYENIYNVVINVMK